MKYIGSFILLIAFTISCSAQVSSNTTLYQTILSKDSLLFNIGFNTCAINQFENLLSESFEFYHDKDSISDKQRFLYSLKNGLCISPGTYQSRRELVKGSTEVYPLYKNDIIYGAMQMGVHKFFEKIADKKERFASTAKFTHVWLLENGDWKLARSFSYDHQVAKEIIKKPTSGKPPIKQ